jgi:hypothetical protein
MSGTTDSQVISLDDDDNITSLSECKRDIDDDNYNKSTSDGKRQRRCDPVRFMFCDTEGRSEFYIDHIRLKKKITFRFLDTIINDTIINDTIDFGNENTILMCLGGASCNKSHTGCFMIDLSEIIKSKGEIVFIRGILCSYGKTIAMRSGASIVRMDGDIRNIITALDYLGLEDDIRDGAYFTTRLINDVLKKYESITIASSALIHHMNSTRTEANRIKHQSLQLCALDLNRQQISHNSIVNTYTAWFDHNLYDDTHFSQLCQSFCDDFDVVQHGNSMRQEMLCHEVKDFTARDVAYGATHTEELLDIVKCGKGVIAGQFAAAMAQKNLYYPPTGASVDVFFFQNDFFEHGHTDYVRAILNSWLLGKNYVPDPIRSSDTITFRHEHFVPVVVRDIEMTKRYEVVWEFDTDFLRACMNDARFVHYCPIATKDWADKTHTRTGFMTETFLYPHNREHCRGRMSKARTIKPSPGQFSNQY